MPNFISLSNNFRVPPATQKLVWSMLFVLFSVMSLQAQSGAVFRDFNGNGTKDTNEPLVSGILVKAFNAAGTQCASTTSAGTNAPNYNLTGCSGQVRVEFEIPATGNCVNSGIDFSSASGTTYGSSVQFVTSAATNVNFAVHNPSDYNTGTTGVNVFIPCYISGDPLVAGTVANADWFVGYPYTNSGPVGAGTGAGTPPSQKVNGAIIGPTWGVAYSKQAKKVFTSALLKRHVGLGKLGSGGIYMLEPTATSFNVTEFYDMDANNHRTRADASAPAYGEGTSYSIAADNSTITYLGTPNDPLTGKPSGLGVIGTNTQRGLTSNPLTPSHDPAAFDQIGKVGLGDIDISDDGKYLFVVNLYSRKVFRLELDDAYNPMAVANVTSYDIPATTCTNGEYRPWGLKFFRNKLYVGVVCSAENAGGTAANLTASVYELNNPTASATFNTSAVVSLPLNYNKTGDYNPWTNNSNKVTSSLIYPQPLLSDIEFTDNGDMVLGIMDRAGNQWGENNRRFLKTTTTSVTLSTSGDMLIAGFDCNTGVYTLENNGTVTSANGATLTGVNPQTGAGPGGKEFFDDNSIPDSHDETATGALAVLKGQGEVMSSNYAQNKNSGDAGTMKLSTTDGSFKDYYQLYYRNNPPGILAKANGLGDMELSGIEAPIEIGNRIWKDTDKDGIQDADEVGVDGVVIELYEGTTATGSPVQTVTSATLGGQKGSWYFTDLKANQDYVIKVKTALGAGALATCTAFSPTGAGTTLIDNNTGTGTIALKTGNAGENNHSFDIGVNEAPVCVKPNAGTDQSPTCVGNTPITTATLAATAVSGGAWTQVGTTPNTATITDVSSATSTVTGLLPGVYKFIWATSATCSDTVQITIPNCACVKPNAGTDQTLACANVATNTLTTSTTLVPVTAGGTFTQIGTTPAVAAIAGNAVSGMTVAGTYLFQYSVAGCLDTVAVTVEPCTGCVRPNTGPDAPSVCQPISTAKLTAMTAGGTWAPISSPANPSAATIDASGNITGLSAAGTYKFVYSITGGGLTCTDTAQVVVNAKPVITDGSATICAGETVDLTSKITNFAALLSPVWTIATAGGTAVSPPTAVKPTATTTYVLVAQNAAGCKDTAIVVVTVNPKPNAGTDQTLACANAVTNTLTTSTTLVPVTTGGTFTQIGTAPAVATITGNAVSGMTVAGTYQFQYSVAGCLDTVAVTVESCSGCVKPNAGSDITLTCPPTGIAPATATLAPVTTGGSWTAQSGNPATASVTGNNVAGLTASGTYKFIYSVTGGGQTCTDTVQVTVPTCVQPKGSLGDFVWKDTNNNGIQDETTPNAGGVAGVQIELYKNGTFFAKDTTDATGKYLFTNLDAATYKIKVLTASIPTGCEISSVKDAPNDDAKDSDVDKTTGFSGDYVIAPLDPTKKDILTVDAALAVPCVKSKVTLTSAPICSADILTYSFSFSLVNKAGIIKVNKGNLTGSNPYTVTGIPSGANLTITDSLSAVCKFDTLITGINCNCNPALPTLITPNMSACAGDTFPTLKATVVGLATVEWFTQPTGGTAVFTGLNYKPSGTVPTTGAFFYAQARSTDPTCPTAVSMSRVKATLNAQDCTKEVDLALKKSINTKTAQIGNELTYTLKVWNEFNTNATGVEVTDSIAATVQFVTGSFVSSRGTATITGNIIKWVIGGIAANGDTVTLTYQVKATQEGIHFNTAEISKVNEKDKDSTPGNGKDNEDDIDHQCFTVPIKLCTGQKAEASVPAYLTNVQWFKNTDTTPVATGNTVLLTEVGSYRFTATNQTCPVDGCCPVIIEAGVNCCPVNLCIPLTIKKIKK